MVCCTATMVVGTLLIIWLARQPFWQFLHAIKGHRLTYFWNLITLKRYRRRHPKGRQDLHDIWDMQNIAKIGMASLPEEVEYANPKLNRSEDLFIYGANTGERTTIQVHFKRRPLPQEQASGRFESPKDQVAVSLKLHDGQGNVYWLEEQSVVAFSATEYRGSGFAFEALEGNRTGRIKFRGYLRRNDEAGLLYVQIRFLCLSFSKTFDHQRQFDVRWMARELNDQSIGNVEEMLEDRIEQFCQIKGTFKVENNEETELFFLGTVGRRFAPESAVFPRKVIKVSGFNTEGVGFQVGLVQSGKFIYRYGFSSANGDVFKLMRETTIKKEQFSDFINKKEVAFEVNFGGNLKSLKIEVGKSIGHGRRLIRVDGVEGIGFVTEDEFTEIEKFLDRSAEDKTEELKRKLVVALDEDCATVTELTGGKGASLAQLKKLSVGSEWQVPNAVVVTSSAYRMQTEAIKDFNSRLKDLEANVIARKDVEKSCQQFVAWFASNELHEKVKSELKRKLASEFGAEWESMLFAVRSSAANEDSSEMSAAGQMTTYLGVSGLERVARAVVACWASQFAFVPAEYKRGYGQALSAPMAVVVQRMVNCSSAGVIFTANPTDGDERVLTVTSNFGLGESVVSAAAEPDTFTLAVDIEANSYQTRRRISSIASKQLGKKALVTRLNTAADQEDIKAGIQNEQIADGATRQSLSDEDLIRLGNIALDIAAHYGNPRDIEWGLVDGQLFMFQSRPITNLDSSFTAYELMHEDDSPHVSETEIYSRAHWAEIFPNASTWLAMFAFMNGTGFFRARIMSGEKSADEFNPFNQDWGYMYNQLMFNIKNGPFTEFFRGYPKNENTHAMIMAMFGRHLTDPDVLACFNEPENPPKKSWKARIMLPMMMVQTLFFLRKKIYDLRHRIFEENFGDFVTPMRSERLQNKFNFIYQFASRCMQEVLIHRQASMGSAIKTAILNKVLKSSADTFHVEEDLNLLMSSCNDVVSAEVPNMLRDIAKAIDDKASFVQLSDEEAIEVLRGNVGAESRAVRIFADFIKRHGHRGYRELDYYYMPFRANPIPCVQVIKSLLKGGSSLEAKVEVPIEEIMAKIQTPLSSFKRALIQKWLLPWCRDGVGYRENTKSIMIKFQDNIRKAMWLIAEEMVQVGYLPEADLFFFLKMDEIQRLLKGERNPLLVMKAKQRKRLYPTMNALKFDEFVKGFRMAPRPPKKEMIQLAEDSVCMKGTPVTVGSIKARVCVAETIEEAVHIRPGDILLTYSTDIGWSPYFPLLSGIVTEIGGTVSHGAVIAREFGIPCLIAVEDVCQYFRTGDIAYLDTKTGTIVKVKE